MRQMLIPLVTIAGLGLSACMMDGPAGGTSARAGTPAGATAILRDAGGVEKGTARFRQAGADLKVDISAMGLPPGPKGLHLHTVGKCDAPDFASAGGHWNPTTMKHGKDAPTGPHMGDIPNIEIAADGTGTQSFTIRGAALTGGAMPLLDADGAAIIIHAGPDDYRTDPSGNSGGRVACGVVTPA